MKPWTRFTLFILTLFSAGPALSQGNSLAEALDTPGLTWITYGDKLWESASAADAKSGGDVARCGPLSEEMFLFHFPVSSTMATTVSGPGTFRIFVRSNGAPYLNASLSVDQVVVETMPLEMIWQRPAMTQWKAITCALPPGSHELEFTVCLGCDQLGTLPLGSPVVEADFASVLPPSASAGEGMDATGPPWVWINGGDPGFTLVHDVTHDGVDALFANPALGVSWLETTVSGPATLSWWRKGGGTVGINSMEAARSFLENWTLEKAFIPPGDHRIRWLLNSGNSPMYLDGFSRAAESFVGVPEGLDTPGRAYATSAGWQGYTSSNAPDGSDLAWVQTTDVPAWLQTTVTGPALVESKWRTRRTGYWNLDVFVDNFAAVDPTLATSYNGDAVPPVFVPAGVHTVRWQVTPNYPEPSEIFWMLDAVKISPASPDQIPSALDAEGLAWSTGGAPWQAVSATLAHDGTDMVYSPAVAGGEPASWIETSVTGPGVFSAWVGTLSHTSAAQLVVDGAVLNSIAFDWRHQWRREVVELPAGNHTIRFEVNTASAHATLLLDQVSWTSAAALPMATALDLPPGKLYSDGVLWTVDTAVHSDGADSLRIELDPADINTPASPEVAFWVNGPATLALKTRCENATFTVSASGTQASSSSSNWTPLTLEIAPGLRRVVLSIRSPLQIPQPPVKASWVDAVTVTSTAMPMAEALGTPGRTWITNPDNPWSGIAAGPGQLPRAGAGSTELPAESWLETTVTGPAVVAFQVLGFFEMLMDGLPHGTVQNNASESSTRRTVWVPPGSHALRWTRGSGSLSAVTVSPQSAAPSFVSSPAFRFTVPRPAGYTDDLIRLETAPAPDGPWTRVLPADLQFYQSTAAGLIMELKNVPGETRLFVRINFL